MIAGWDDPLVVLAGMVGARGGWIEVPYVRCPADTAALAAGNHGHGHAMPHFHLPQRGLQHAALGRGAD